MFVRFLLGRRVFKWMLLFVSAMSLAIILAQTLNRSETASFAKSVLSNSSTSLSEVIAQSSFQPQAKYDRRLAHYATVFRSDGSFRQMFIDEAAIAAIQPGKPLPNGTLIVMETWYSPENLGTVFVKQKQEGRWQYGSFNPAQPDYQMSFSSNCHSCHVPFWEQDFTLTKPLLEAALQTRQVQTSFCNRAGRAPCNPKAYIPAS